MKRLRDWPEERALKQWDSLIVQPGVRKRGTVEAPRLPVIEPPQTLFQAGMSNSSGIDTQQVIEDKAAFDQALQVMGDRAEDMTHKLSKQFADLAGPGAQSQDIASAIGRRAPLALEDVAARSGLIEKTEDTENAEPLVEEKAKEQSSLCYVRTDPLGVSPRLPHLDKLWNVACL